MRKKTNSPKKLPNRLELLTKFKYDPQTGQLYLRRSGKAVGHKADNGYIIVYVDRKRYKAHRIIYKMFHGVDPKGKDVDHRDGDPSNNAITNLRVVQRRTNIKNTQAKRDAEGLPPQDPNAHPVAIARHKKLDGWVTDDF